MYRRIRLTTVCAIVALAAAAWPGQAGALHSAGSPAVAASMAGQTVVSSQQVTESSVASARRHCRWDRYPTGGSYRTCIRVIDRLRPRFKPAWGYKYVNDTPNWNTGTCTSKETDTFSWGGSITVGVEAKAWIFAKVSADVSANFQKTRTTERSTSPSFKLPPRSKRYCFDGVDFERYKVRRCTLSSYAPGHNDCRVKLFRAPAIQTWRITTRNVHSGSA